MRSTAYAQRAAALTTGPAIAVRGSDAQVALTDWLMHELDRRVPEGAGDEYLGPAPDGEAVRTFFRPNWKSEDFQSAVERVRQTTGVHRILFCQRAGAIVIRGAADQVATAATVLR
ncbi:MAG TPA: hypothetical protein VKX45_19095 [Bryobacteraceae bacterium]|jgi:hypothetical protein|nr:hypothetical protein [Bryobacteraceae bacterium]